MPTRFFSTSCSLPSTLLSESLSGCTEIFDGFVAAVEVHPRGLLELGERRLGEIEERLVVLSERVGGQGGEGFAQFFLGVLEECQLFGRRPALGGELSLEPRPRRCELGSELRADDGDLALRLRPHDEPHARREQQAEGDQTGDDQGHDTKFRRRGSKEPVRSYDRDVNAELTRDEVLRYSRHLTLPEVGVDGQKRLKAARVLCIGAGGLGSPAAMYLAAAGVGTIGLVDEDVVDVSNLHRQIIHGTSDVGRSKLTSATDRLREINPHVRIEAHDVRFGERNALDLVSAYDVIVDGTDNFPTRYLVNDACVLAGRPNAYGSISRFEGQASVFAVRRGPCYRCLHPEPPPPGLIPSCAEGGVLGVLPGIIGTIQATEAVKLILGIGEPLVGRFLIYDALRMQFRVITLPKDPDCPVCGTHPTIRELRAYADIERCAPPAIETRSERSSMAAAATSDITVTELKARIDRGDAPMIIDVREPAEFEICRIPGAVLIPLSQLRSRIGELDTEQELVLHCKVGGRSANATEFLKRAGFTHARNLTGGILAWIDQVDPSQPKY